MSKSAGRQNKLRYKILLSLGSCVLTLALIETGFRLFSGTYYVSALIHPSSIPGLGYQFVPDTNVYHPQGGHYKINRWGFKGPDFPKEKPPSYFRIMFLGDSVVYGEIAGKRDLVRVEEENLQSNPPVSNLSFQPINTAVPSYGTCQELALLKGYVDSFEPDMIVVGYVMNDPEGVRVPFGLDVTTGKLPWIFRLYHEIKRRSYLLQWLINNLSPTITRLRNRTDYGPAPELQRHNYFKYVQTLHDPRGEWWRSCAACISEFGAYQREKRVPVVFLIFPLWYYTRDASMVSIIGQVARAAKKAGLAAIDMSRYIPKGGPLENITTDGMHMTVYGHSIAADALHEYLIKHPELFAGRGRYQRRSGPQPPARE